MNMARPLFHYSTLALLICANTAGFAAGFALEEQNAVQTGDFGAGGAAIAEDASTAWYNPGGLIRIQKPQVVLSGNEIWFNTAFNGSINYSVTDSGTTGPVAVQNVLGGTANFIPTFHAAYPLTPNVVAGFSVTTPFGLATDYGTSTNLRYATTETKIKTIDLSPSVGFKINSNFSVGFGIDEQRFLTTFDDYAGAPTTTAYDTLNHNSASDWALGWHSGILYQPTNTTRFGLAYHSKVIHHATGYSIATGPLASARNDAYTTLNMPAKTELSVYHDMNNRWAVMGSVSYTQWAILNNITLNNFTSPSGPIVVTIPENFNNAWRFSVGTNYKVNDQWLVRAGLGYDQAPVNTKDRNLLLPDGDRYALSIGGRYQATKNLALDAGFTHEFIKTVGLNYTTAAAATTNAVSGKSVSSANILGLQMTYSFA